MVSMVMVDATMREIFDAIMKMIPEESWFRYAVNRVFKIIDNMNGSILGAWMPLHGGFYINSWTTTAGALLSALICLRARSETFREGAVLAANFTRDADTISAVAGAILGTKCGASPISTYWVEETWHSTGICLQFINGLDIKEMTGELAKPVD